MTKEQAPEMAQPVSWVSLDSLYNTVKDHPCLQPALNALTKPLPETKELNATIAKLPGYYRNREAETIRQGIRRLENSFLFPNDPKKGTEVNTRYRETFSRVMLFFAYAYNADKNLAVIKVGERRVALNQINSLIEIANRIAMNETRMSLIMENDEKLVGRYSYQLRCPAITDSTGDGCHHSSPLPPPDQNAWDGMGTATMARNW